MSSNTKIVVLKSKELIYTGIFIVLGIILIFLLFNMFSPNEKSDDKNKTTTQTTSEEETTTATYMPGMYTSELNIGGTALQLSVAVDEDVISHVDISNLDETVTAMYPLLTPALDEINAQISTVNSIEEISYSEDNQYTTIILLEAIEAALSKAQIP